LAGPEWQLRVKVTVPTGPTRLGQLLPLAQEFADAVVGSAAKGVEARGQTVSCKAGCGACCRQLVPIAEVEARHIRDLLRGLPEPRRTAIRTRFAEARERLEEVGLLERLQHPDGWSDGEGRSLGLRYFQQGIPCPFLEAEACSIYSDRPIACREYMVTSPAENCARPTAETVDCVKPPLKVWTAMARFDQVSPRARFIRWVPLILAPEWAEAHPDEPPPRPGPDLVRDFFDHVTGKRQPQGQPPPSPFDPDALPASGHHELSG
jgi:Fe-S-cluster containining protein